jgi:hypothetical protein
VLRAIMDISARHEHHHDAVFAIAGRAN